jgi:hypothetical protein
VEMGGQGDSAPPKIPIFSPPACVLSDVLNPVEVGKNES